MKITKLTRPFETGLGATIKVLSWLAVLSSALMALIVVINVFGRLFFNWPLPGTMEMVELLMVPICFFAMPYTARLWGHVKVDLVLRMQPKRTQGIMSSIGYFLCFGTWAAITYREVPLALPFIKNLHQASAVLSIPFAPFRLIAVLGSLVLCLMLAVLIFRPLRPTEDDRGGLT